MITRRERTETSKKAGNALDGEVKKAVNDLIDEVKKSPVMAKKTAVKNAVAKGGASVKSAPAVKKIVATGGKRMDFVKKSNVEELNRKLAENKPVGATKKQVTASKKPATVSEKPVPVSKKPVAVAKKSVVKPKAKVAKKEAPKKPPLASVIIPVRNGARYIDSTIHSVLGQTFADFELIIVDDASEDGTLRVVKEFSSEKILIVPLDHKSGMAEARNVGVKKASGRYICFLNARDMWQPDKLERQIEFMRGNDSAFSFTSYVFADEDGMPFGKVVKAPAEISKSSLAKVSGIWVSTVMFDLARLAKDDIMMPDVKNAKTATWEKVLKKTSVSHGLNEVLAIRACEHKTPLWKKVWRR